MTIRAGHGSGNQRAEIPLGRVRPGWVCSQQTGSRCRVLRCHTGCCCHTTGSFCQPVGHSASQPANLHAHKHDRRLSWWEPGIEAPLQIKEFQLAALTEPRAAVYRFFACCDLSNPRFVSLSPLCLPSSFSLCLFLPAVHEGWLVEATKRVMGVNRLLAGVIHLPTDMKLIVF